jgi:capsid protein
MREGRVVAMHDTEGKAVKSAIFFNDLYETDKYYVKKIDKRKDDYRLYEYEGE